MEETTASILAIQANNNNNIGISLQPSRDQDKHPNDMPIVPDIIINVDPYSLTFNIITSFTLSIDDEYCPYYTQGFNLLHESRTSKLYIALYRFCKGWIVIVMVVAYPLFITFNLKVWMCCLCVLNNE
jgi:hypothetical protein